MSMSTKAGVSRRALLRLAGLVGGAALAGSVADGAIASVVPRLGQATPSSATIEELSLPAPRLEGTVSLEQALLNRRSHRRFGAEPLTLEQLSQLLWAAQGITDPSGKRTAPSAGATYPIELYVVSADGVSQYSPTNHTLLVKSRSDVRASLPTTAAGAPVAFVITAVHERVTARFRTAQGPRFVHMEAGHVAQNLLLQAVALGLVGVPMGSVQEERLQVALDLPSDHAPLYIVPIGYPQT